MGGSQGADSGDSSSRERHTDTSTPSKFVYARPLECWPLRELIGDVYKVANMTSLRSQVIKAFHMVHGMFKGSFSEDRKFVQIVFSSTWAENLGNDLFNATLTGTICRHGETP